MTAVVSRERARTTCLTGAAGALMLAVAVVMMMVAAPAHGQARAHGPAKPSAVQFTTDACHQLKPGSDPAAVRACRAGSSADAHVPSTTCPVNLSRGPGVPSARFLRMTMAYAAASVCLR